MSQEVENLDEARKEKTIQETMMDIAEKLRMLAETSSEESKVGRAFQEELMKNLEAMMEKL